MAKKSKAAPRERQRRSTRASRGARRLPILLLTQLDPDHVDVTDKDKIEHLKKIIEKVLGDTDKDASADRRRWLLWFVLYLIWWESDRLRKRTQSGGGPARGIIQMEPQTLWDVLRRYVMSASVAGAVKNLADAAGVGEDEMKKAIRAFLKKNATGEKDSEHGTNEWPSDDEDAAKLEGWLRSNDTFAVKLLRYFFKWHKDEFVPPSDSGDLSGDPQDDKFKPQHAKGWGEGYNRGAEGKSKQDAFVERAKGLDQTLID